MDETEENPNLEEQGEVVEHTEEQEATETMESPGEEQAEGGAEDAPADEYEGEPAEEAVEAAPEPEAEAGEQPEGGEQAEPAEGEGREGGEAGAPTEGQGEEEQGGEQEPQQQEDTEEQPAEGEAEAASEPLPAQEEQQEGGEQEAPAATTAESGDNTDAPAPADEEPPRGPAPPQEEASSSGRDEREVLHILCFLGSRDRSKMIQVPVSTRARDLLLLAAREMGADPAIVSGIYKGNKLDPERAFDSFGLMNGDAIEVDILAGLNEDIVSYKGGEPRAETSDATVLEVEVETEGAARIVHVLIDTSQLDRKKYLGGYRNKKTGLTYHHASSQTTRVPRWTEADRKLTRETQTVKVKLHSMQAVREAATQMSRPDLIVDGAGDRAVEPRPYVTADEVWRVKEEKTVIIQRYTRGWFARRRAARLRAEKREREERERAEADARAEEEEERTLREIQRRMHPKSREDFEILRSEVERWREQETRKIKGQGLEADQEHLALEELLYKQTKLLQTIDRLKVQAQGEIRAGKIDRVLQSMAAPKRWAVADGSQVEVHTPFTTRARELLHLYQGLCLPVQTVDARLNVLLHVKYTVKEFDCSLTREIVELVDREADLLNRGRPTDTMDGLRKRISNLFLAFIETPEFNPVASKYTINPPTRLEMVRSTITRNSVPAAPSANRPTAKQISQTLKNRANEILSGTARSSVSVSMQTAGGGE